MEQKKREKQKKMDNHFLLTSILASFSLNNYESFHLWICLLIYQVKILLFYLTGFHRKIFKDFQRHELPYKCTGLPLSGKSTILTRIQCRFSEDFGVQKQAPRFKETHLQIDGSCPIRIKAYFRWMTIASLACMWYWSHTPSLLGLLQTCYAAITEIYFSSCSALGLELGKQIPGSLL